MDIKVENIYWMTRGKFWDYRTILDARAGGLNLDDIRKKILPTDAGNDIYSGRIVSKENVTVAYYVAQKYQSDSTDEFGRSINHFLIVVDKKQFDIPKNFCESIVGELSTEIKLLFEIPTGAVAEKINGVVDSLLKRSVISVGDDNTYQPNFFERPEIPVGDDNIYQSDFKKKVNLPQQMNAKDDWRGIYKHDPEKPLFGIIAHWMVTSICKDNNEFFQILKEHGPKFVRKPAALWHKWKYDRKVSDENLRFMVECFNSSKTDSFMMDLIKDRNHDYIVQYFDEKHREDSANPVESKGKGYAHILEFLMEEVSSKNMTCVNAGWVSQKLSVKFIDKDSGEDFSIRADPKDQIVKNLTRRLNGFLQTQEKAGDETKKLSDQEIKRT